MQHWQGEENQGVPADFLEENITTTLNVVFAVKYLVPPLECKLHEGRDIVHCV